MKIFFTSDTHIGMSPLNLQDWLDRQEEYFYEFYIPLLKEKYEEGDILVHLGDLYDNRTHIDIKAMNFAEKLVKDISSILPFHLIVGNHDMYNKSKGDINSVNLFDNIDNVTVYNKPGVLNLNGKKMVFIPWIDRRMEQIEVLKKYSPADYLFCHSDLNGCKLHMKSVSHRSTDRIELDEFDSYGKVYAGHVHITQKSGNFTYVGSPMEYDRGDYQNQKGVFILDTSDGSEDFILNTISPKFKKLSILNEDDISKLDSVDANKDYIDLSISNTLLISNRKMRRKLEKILEVSSFSSVDYVNDLVKDDDEVVDDDLVDMELTDFTDFVSVITDYINKQDLDDNIKDGILSEFDGIVEIYNSSYVGKKVVLNRDDLLN